MNIRFKKSFKLFTVLLLLLSLLVVTGCKKDKPVDPDKGDEDKPAYDLTDLSVRDFKGENGVIAAANPYAAQAGIDVLKQGGNAFDAAVAVAFALGVVEPNASGVGGGGILVGWDAQKGEYVSYNFREFIPGLGTKEVLNTNAKLDDGVLSAGVPTEVAGLIKVTEDHGALTVSDNIAPAIKLANEGFPVTPGLAANIYEGAAKIFEAGDETIDVFTRDGIDTLAAGDILKQVNYGKVLQKISDEGLDGFYKGDVANAIIAANGPANNGIITQEDLDYVVANYPVIETPVFGNYNGYDIASANIPSSGGIILIEALNMLKSLDLKSMNHNSAEYINAIATAMQLAYGDKRKYIADNKINPANQKPFNNVPVSVLTSDIYASDRFAACYNPTHAFLGRNAAGGSDYGNPFDSKYENLLTENSNPLEFTDNSYDYVEHYSTTAFSVADKHGNIVSVTQTINHFWGNGIVPAGCGFFMNNQLSSFSTTPGSVHYVAPYKQPVSHIMPTIVMKDGNPWATLGSPGGLRIPSAVLQTLLNLIEFDFDIQKAIAAPRVYCYAVGSSDPDSTKLIEIEGDIPQDVQDKLIEMGYNLVVHNANDFYFGGVHGIRFTDNGMHGGADPRRDGKAIGY